MNLVPWLAVPPWCAVAVGGALGALARYAVAKWFVGLNLAATRPYDALFATFTVNLVGSCLMGLAYGLIVEHWQAQGPWREFFMVGILGALTTFSTFALEVVHLWQQQQVLAALSYIGISVLACCLGIVLGLYLVRSSL